MKDLFPERPFMRLANEEFFISIGQKMPLPTPKNAD